MLIYLAIGHRVRLVHGLARWTAMVLVPAWGLSINSPTTSDTCSPLATPAVYGLVAIYALSLVAHAIARRQPDRLPPLMEALLNGQLVLGVVR